MSTFVPAKGLGSEGGGGAVRDEPLLAGVLRDATGSYALPRLAAVVALAAAIPLILSVTMVQR
jgi:hypothetical protein